MTRNELRYYEPVIYHRTAWFTMSDKSGQAGNYIQSVVCGILSRCESRPTVKLKCVSSNSIKMTNHGKDQKNRHCSMLINMINYGRF